MHAQQKASQLVALAEESENLYKFIFLEFGNHRVSAMKMKANLSFGDRVQYFLEFTVQVSEEPWISRGTDWLPAECDVSIRPGWFWHKSESPKKLSELLDIYYKSVGRNCVLLLNIPPNTTGLISENDAHRLKEFRSAINTIFHKNIAEDCYVKVSSRRGGKEGGFGPENMLDSDHLWSYWTPREDDKEKDHWIEIWDNDGSLRFNVIRIQEAIGLGQRIERYEIYVDGKSIIKGTTIGYKRLHRLDGDVVHARVVRIRFIKARGVPLISSIGLHFDPFWHSRFTAA